MAFRDAARLGLATWGLLATSILSLAGCGTTTPQRGDGVPIRPPMREVLPNGLRLIVQQHSASEVVAVHLWIGVGGRDEGPQQRGFSHFVEHLLFRATEGLGSGFVDREVEAFGGRTNAGTSLDYTFYHMLLPARRAERAIQVLAEMAFRATFDPVEIDREREVVFEEMRLNEDTPRRALGRGLYQALFQGHPYASPVLGEASTLRAATRQSLLDYYAKHYSPENMTLVVVGDVDPIAIRQAAERFFGWAPARGYRRIAVATVTPTGGGERRLVERPERHAWLGMAWPAPGLGQPDMYAVDLLGHVLGGSRSSRLTQALREQARVASSVHASYGALQGGGMLSVLVQCDPGALDLAEDRILVEVRRIQDEGVSEDERERAVTASESQRVFAAETAEGLAHAYGHAETLWSLDAERAYLDRLRQVTTSEIREAARRYLSLPPARLAFSPKSPRP